MLWKFREKYHWFMAIYHSVMYDSLHVHSITERGYHAVRAVKHEMKVTVYDHAHSYTRKRPHDS